MNDPLIPFITYKLDPNRGKGKHLTFTSAAYQLLGENWSVEASWPKTYESDKWGNNDKGAGMDGLSWGKNTFLAKFNASCYVAEIQALCSIDTGFAYAVLPEYLKFYSIKLDLYLSVGLSSLQCSLYVLTDLWPKIWYTRNCSFEKVDWMS